MSENVRDTAVIWRQTLNQLGQDTLASEFDLAMLRQSKVLTLSGQNLVVAVAGEMVQAVLESKYLEVLQNLLANLLDLPAVTLITTVDESLAHTLSSPPPAAPAATPPASSGFLGNSPGHIQSFGNTSPGAVSASYPPGATTSDGGATGAPGFSAAPGFSGAPGGVSAAGSPISAKPGLANKVSGLNPTYTFETFVIGSSNSFTAAAAESVVVSPAQAYNPLFIYGGSGLGKTHLLHAIGNYAIELNPNSNVKYVSSEEFTNEFINAIATQSFPAFQAKYREVDFLLIDDIQFLEGKEQTLEEFFHTFNTLHTAGKQVVITSDVPPKELNSFEERIKSRLEWGLMTDIQPPNLETRIAILRRKAAQSATVIPEDVITFIASKVSSNIRELEGALIRVSAWSSLEGQEISLQKAQEVLRDYITGKGNREITPRMIIEFTAKYFHVSPEEILSTDRSRSVVGPRQIAMYLCRELTELSLPKVGECFGGRDHTTVMHAVKKITNSMNQDTEIYQSVTDITNEIRRAAHES